MRALTSLGAPDASDAAYEQRIVDGDGPLSHGVPTELLGSLQGAALERRGVPGVGQHRPDPVGEQARVSPGTSAPFSPSWTMVASPPTRDATTGVPQAIDSTATSPNDS